MVRTTRRPWRSYATRQGREAGLRPLGRLVSGRWPGWSHTAWASARCRRPELWNERHSRSDIDLIELNEAFAAQVLGCFRGWGLTQEDLDRVNVNGSGISLGHPIGATGGRILANLLREMERRGSTFGMETMCIGGGQGLAAIFERIPASG